MITDDYRGRRCFLCVAPFIRYPFSLTPFHPLPAGNTGEFVPTFPYCRCRLDRGRKTMTAPLEKNREPWIFPFFFAPPSSPSHSPSRNSPFCFIYSAGCWSVSFRRKKKKKGEKELGHFFFFSKRKLPTCIEYSRIWIAGYIRFINSIHFRIS